MKWQSSTDARFLRTALRKHTQAIIFFIGAVIVLLGVILWIRSGPGQLGTIFISVGSSLMAASIAAYLSPLSEAVYEVYERFRGLGIEDVYPSRDEIPKKLWIEWLRSARRYCILLGIAHSGWRRDPDFRSALFDRLGSGVQVKVFFLDPTSSAAEFRNREDETRNTEREIRETIGFVWEFRAKLDKEHQKRLLLYVYNATPSCGLTWVDSFMVATHYLAGFANVSSPALLLKPVGSPQGSRSLYDIYAENLQKLESQSSTEIKEENIGNYIPR